MSDSDPASFPTFAASSCCQLSLCPVAGGQRTSGDASRTGFNFPEEIRVTLPVREEPQRGKGRDMERRIEERSAGRRSFDGTAMAKCLIRNQITNRFGTRDDGKVVEEGGRGKQEPEIWTRNARVESDGYKNATNSGRG